MGGVVRCLAVLSSLNMVIGETWCSFIMPKAVVQSADSRFVIECNWQQVRKHLVPKSSHKGHLAICRVSPSSRNSCEPSGSWCAAWVTAVLQENVHKNAARLYQMESSLCSVLAVCSFFSPADTALPEAGCVPSLCLGDQFPASHSQLLYIQEACF